MATTNTTQGEQAKKVNPPCNHDWEVDEYIGLSFCTVAGCGAHTVAGMRIFFRKVESP